jgi:hypothetical protein
MVITAAGNEVSIGAEGNRPDATCMPLKYATALTRAAIPQSDGSIFTATGKSLTI